WAPRSPTACSASASTTSTTRWSASPAWTCPRLTTARSRRAFAPTRRRRRSWSRRSSTSNSARAKERKHPMAQLLEMPKLSDTMKEGVLRKWIKKEGDKVSPGDLLAEVETDKATMDFESFDG